MRESDGRSNNGVGEDRRLSEGRELVSPGRREGLGFAGVACLAFCSNKLLRSFTAGVTLTWLSSDWADIRKGEVTIVKNRKSLDETRSYSLIRISLARAPGVWTLDSE